jgi:hypothetical protein
MVDEVHTLGELAATGTGTGLGGSLLTFIAMKYFSKNGDSIGGKVDILSTKMDIMIERQHEGNLILAKIEGLLSK